MLCQGIFSRKISIAADAFIRRRTNMRLLMILQQVKSIKLYPTEAAGVEVTEIYHE